MRGNHVRSALVLLGLVSSSFAASTASSQNLSSLPALAPALAELRSELALTEAQSADASNILVELMGRAKAAVDEFGGLSFESMLDLLVEARSIRNDYGPRIMNFLTEEQKQKLEKLPRRHEIYTSAMSGWLAEAQLERLKERAGLTEEQLPQVRSILVNQFQDAVGIVEGLVKKEDFESMKDEILGVILDLRSIQRQGRRGVDKLLTEEQRVRIEKLRKEPETDEARRKS
jgi:hypothetical protein